MLFHDMLVALAVGVLATHVQCYFLMDVALGKELFGTTVCMYIYVRTSDCLGCAVLLCLVVCLTLLASFFLPSLISH